MAEEVLGNSGLRQKTDRVIDNGFDRAQSGLDTARTGAHRAIENTDDALETAREYITRNAQTRPLATAAAAAGVGLLVGMLFARR